MERRQAHVNKLLNILKLALIVLTFGFIFYKLFYAYHLPALYRGFIPDFSTRNILILGAILALAALNWLTETYKWHLLISRKEKMSYFHALKAVLSGVLLSVITPNQIGDFAGRVLYLKAFNKIKGSLVTVVGHSAQMLMTMVFGIYGFIWFNAAQGHLSAETMRLMTGILLLLTGFTIFLYLHISRLSTLNLGKKITPFLEAFSGYSRRDLIRVLILAFIRYSIFILQYHLLLRFYQVDTGLTVNLMCITSTLMVQSFVPSFLLLDMGMRGASALWFFGFFTGMQPQVLMAAYTLWCVNLLLPGLTGLYYLLKWRQDR